MEDTSFDKIKSIIDKQKIFFNERNTIDIHFRKENLKKLKDAIEKNEKRICDAIWQDLHKSYEESYLTEISIVKSEIDYHLKKLKSWTKPKRVRTPIHLLPSRSRIFYEPLGVSLIISPWNYPFQLLINPLVGAISAGCCAVLKPSPYVPTFSKVIEELIAETFDEKYISVVQGGRKVNQYLLEQRFDFIFYTGSPAVGKVVMGAASKYLTPVVLELGGKSPCIVDEEANIEIAAKRIAWGKTLNAGQTCIAPDYLFVHKNVKEKLLDEIIKNFRLFFGDEIKQSNYFVRIVNDAAFERLVALLKKGRIIFGGKFDKVERYIEPTLIDEVSPEDEIMQEEIFGPILPVMTFENISEVIKFVNEREKPLAFYYFGNVNKAKGVFRNTTSGGGCINDTILHIANHNLPFGGVGNSGIGKYHGYNSFLAFSNQRSVVITPTIFDLPFRYAPYKYFNLIKKIL